jgi:hypothetical protein
VEGLEAASHEGDEALADGPEIVGGAQTARQPVDVAGAGQDQGIGAGGELEAPEEAFRRRVGQAFCRSPMRRSTMGSK